MTQLSAKAALGQPMLTRKQAAERMGVTARWLEVNTEAGPAFYRLNSSTIRYAEEDVTDWSRRKRNLPPLTAVVARSGTFRLTESEVARFQSAIRRTDGCWDWVGARCSDFYGRVSLGGKEFPAHQVAYFLANGDISDGSQINQTCRNRGCVRPGHLRAMPVRQNGRGFPNRSGMAGVTWWSQRNKWRVGVGYGGVHHYLGTFDDLGEAKSAALAKRKELHGFDEIEGKSQPC